MEGFLEPDKILDRLDVKPSMAAADFGCGSGGFTIPLARRLEQGIVNALDIQAEVLNALKGLAISENLNNIRFIRCNLESANGSKLVDESMDLVLIVNILFQVENRKTILSEAKRVLKKEGKLLVIDWVSGKIQSLVKNPVSPEEVKKTAAGLGLKLEQEFEAGKFHYGLIFIK